MDTIELVEYGVEEDFGYHRPRASEQLVEQAGNMLDAAWNGNSPMARARLHEAMASSDFVNATLTVIDRETLDRYQALPAVWQGYASRTLVRDFRTKYLVDRLGGLAGLPTVPELNPYPERGVSKTSYGVKVTKRGARFAFSWESWINDQLDELGELPDALATAARETESREAASLLTDGNGPHDTFFNATAIQGTTSNLMTGNPALSQTSLAAAVQTIRARKDAQGRPLAFPRLTLVVPPALEIAARAILTATSIRTTVGAAGNGQLLVDGANYLAGIVDLVVDPWLTVIDLGANVNTTWYIVPTPATGRYALALGFLRGHEDPQVRVKGGQGSSVGGGAIDPTDGSFEIDDIQYRVRHVLGSGYADPIGTIASNGSGS
jgi:hypothetical protein